MAIKKVKIVEVGLRDGLQNESSNLSVQQRFDLIQKLLHAGVQSFEIGAFVSPKWVPQMAVTEELVQKVMNEIKPYAGPQKTSKKLSKNKLHSSFSLQPSVLVPNEQGMQAAIDSGIKEIALFAACSESFSKKNINCTIDESFERFLPIVKMAKKNKIKIRGYLSTCFGCPFEGAVDEAVVVRLAKRMLALGVYEISIGDTIGVANAGQVESLFKKLKKVISVKKLAGHFHDTRGQSLANILTAYKLGVTTFDSSIGGLGGCPYAPGAAGNVATEDVVYMFEGMGVQTGLQLDELISIHKWLQPMINHKLDSKVGRVGELKPLGRV